MTMTTKTAAEMKQIEVVDDSASVVVDDAKPIKLEHINTLGSVRLRHVETNELILVPEPSDDPNDPLNWYVKYSIGIVRHHKGFGCQ